MAVFCVVAVAEVVSMVIYFLWMGLGSALGEEEDLHEELVEAGAWGLGFGTVCLWVGSRLQCQVCHAEFAGKCQYAVG